MTAEKKSNNGLGWSGFLFVVTGSVIALVGTIIAHVWLIPAQEKKLHKYELAEQKVSKLYQPIMLSTGHGNLTLSSDITFRKARRILEQYGHLADQEVIVATRNKNRSSPE